MKQAIITLLGCILLASCQKVLIVKLKNGARIEVEGNLLTSHKIGDTVCAVDNEYNIWSEDREGVWADSSIDYKSGYYEHWRLGVITEIHQF
jgi:hypothetical protein